MEKDLQLILLHDIACGIGKTAAELHHMAVTSFVAVVGLQSKILAP